MATHLAVSKLDTWAYMRVWGHRIASEEFVRLRQDSETSSKLGIPDSRKHRKQGCIVMRWRDSWEINRLPAEGWKQGVRVLFVYVCELYRDKDVIRMIHTTFCISSRSRWTVNSQWIQILVPKAEVPLWRRRSQIWNTSALVRTTYTFATQVLILLEDCGAKNEIKSREPIRCRECGHRIMYKKRTKRSTSNLATQFTSMSDCNQWYNSRLDESYYVFCYSFNVRVR